jgi:hypothetical protein
VAAPVAHPATTVIIAAIAARANIEGAIGHVELFMTHPSRSRF